ncbi:MAG: hypothetical protein ACRDBP_14220 [Luteolibacter sp.]
MMRKLQGALLVGMACLEPVAAELPMIQEPPNLGYFVVVTKTRMDFRVKSENGEMVLGVLGNRRTPVGWPLAINVVIEEILPGGSATPIQVQTLDSLDAATEKLKKVVIAGKTVGDATFEMTIEQIQGAIAIGGRMLLQGTYQNPLRFSIRTDFPNFYVYHPRETAAEKKALQDVIKRDHITLKWTTGEPKRLASDVTLESVAKDLNGPGIATAEINVAHYEGARFQFNASSDSALNLTAKPGPWIEGFSMVWTPNAATAKEGMARLMIEVR